MKVSCWERYFSSQSVYEYETKPKTAMKKTNYTQDAIVREMLNRIFVDGYEPDHRLDRAIEDSRLEYEKKKGRR